MKTAPTVSPEGHVILLYTDGSPCGDKSGPKYSAKVHLICDRVMVWAVPICGCCYCGCSCMCVCICVCVFVCVTCVCPCNTE